MPVDPLKNKVYTAEHRLCDMFDWAGGGRTVSLYGQHLTLPDERKFGALNTVKAYVDWVLDYIGDVYNSPRCDVVIGHGNLTRHAYYQENTIVLPKLEKGNWAWREIVVLHEIAHHLAPDRWHDERFASVLHHLLEKVIGPEAAWLYQVLLHGEGINLSERIEHV